LHGNLPFITSVIAERRFKFCAHVYRATAEKRQEHALAYALAFETTHLKPKVGTHSTFMSTLWLARWLHPMFINRTLSLRMAREIAAERQTKRYRQIYLRRAAHMQFYVDDSPPVHAGKRPPRAVTHPDPTVVRGEVRPSASDFPRSVWPINQAVRAEGRTAPLPEVSSK